MIHEQLLAQVCQIWRAAKENSPLQQKSAVSISTIDASGFPQSRFVDLKAIDHAGFTFCTSYQSVKGQNLTLNPKAALLAWWDHIGYQIRVVGEAQRIADDLADKYWLERSKEAQIASTCFKQSEVWQSACSLKKHFSSALNLRTASISRPGYWGGYTIVPHCIEILKFNSNRVHGREQYCLEDGQWTKRQLQP